MNRTLRIAAVAAAAGGSLVGAASAFGATTGSGATFPQIAYQQWCAESTLCSYTGKGSGGGIKDLTNKVVDWAGSDAPLEDGELAAIGGRIKYFPTLLGAITVPVNIRGVVGNKVKLDGKTVADIFDGDITKWNDRRITKVNKGIKFPAAPIVVCVRSDSSGTSFGFSRYLGKVSKTFAAKVGGGGSKTPNWLAPSLAKSPGNAGVAQCVSSTDNSIGYVDLGDAISSGLQKNVTAIGRNGKYVLPTTKSIVAAGNIKASKVKPNLTVDLSASPAKGAYPITVTTWVLLVPGRATNGAALESVKYFLGKKAQGQLTGFGFAPLSPVLRTLANKQLSSLS